MEKIPYIPLIIKLLSLSSHGQYEYRARRANQLAVWIRAILILIKYYYNASMSNLQNFILGRGCKMDCGGPISRVWFGISTI
jgi:hypothetical protein